MAVPSTLPKAVPSLSRCVPRVRGGRCGGLGTLPGLFGGARSPPGSVVGGTFNGAPATLPVCPVLRRALCSGSGALSRLVCVGAVEGWAGSLAGRGGLARGLATNGFTPILLRAPFFKQEKF